jgi:glucose/mannose-6-phosphate isomerase
VLDDPKYIAQFDRSDGLAVVGGQPDQLQQDYDFDIPVIDDLRNIVVSGMGGSALGAEFLKSFLGERLKVPLEIDRDYGVPGYVGKNTLVIASSYSGNTEEDLAAFDQAKRRGAAIIAMSSGGKLEELSKDLSHIKIPSGLQPRMAVLYEVKALAQILESLKLVSGLTDELEAVVPWLQQQSTSFMTTTPESENPAKQIATAIVGHPAVIYGGPVLAMIAMKWKIDINENAKNPAFYNRLPEFNHNEFNGWVQAQNTGLKVIQLHSSLDSDRIAKRFEITNRLLSGKMPTPIIVKAEGETKLQQMLWTLLLGDYMSLYLAYLNQIDPVPVELIEKLKTELG